MCVTMDLSNSSVTTVSTADAQSPGPDARPTSTLPTSPSPASAVSTVSAPVYMVGNVGTQQSVPANKMYSKNANGTAVLTTIPGNDAELQLYRVMQRASLLVYYDTLLEMGGDDVQQLCDAGEEEFLEIMALVGMASKPLHVRRFQKSLQEWMIDPSAFQVPLASPSSSAAGAVECCSRRSILDTSCRPMYSPSPGASSGSRSSSPLPPPVNNVITADAVLTESQISRLRTAAERLSSRLPTLAPRASAKRRTARDLDAVLSLPDTDPRRMDAIRRYAAIYGRFDCKRRPEKPLTLHEASVNEAAAQLCHFVPALLTRRDELFPLARQLVRDNIYPQALATTTVTVTSSASSTSNINNGKQWCRERKKSNDSEVEHEDEPPPKKPAIADNSNT